MLYPKHCYTQTLLTCIISYNLVSYQSVTRKGASKRLRRVKSQKDNQLWMNFEFNMFRVPEIINSSKYIRQVFLHSHSGQIVINFIIKMNKCNRMTQSIAASDLLRALNTLQQNQGYEEELSFGHRPSNTGLSEQCMNFEIYMKKKTTNPSKKEGTKVRRSITPLKDATIRTNNRGLSTNTEDRSLSPLSQKSLVFGRTQQKLKKNIMKNEQKQNSFKNSVNESMSVSKLSYQTKKILHEKEKQGRVYVPIHQRAEELLKEREVKMARLQKEKEMTRMIKQKQCTFKPKLIKSHFKPVPTDKKPIKDTENWIKGDTSYVNYHGRKEIAQCQSFQEEETFKEISNIEQSMDKSMEIAQETCQTVPDPLQSGEVTVKKYKNQKFNKLLDFLL